MNEYITIGLLYFVWAEVTPHKPVKTLATLGAIAYTIAALGTLL